MKIVSWNVNGFRSAWDKGLKSYLVEQRPDILCLQETKVQEHQLPPDFLELGLDWALSPAKKAGYSGTMIISQKKPLKKLSGLGIDRFDDEGRTVIYEYEKFYVINGYFPNGQRDHGRVPYKLDYYQEVLNLGQKLKKEKAVFILGDVNTAHQEIDLANPKANSKTTGFLPEERAWVDKILAAGWTDTFRHFYPEQVGAYSWWTYRGDCRERNIGWRIDYVLANNESMPMVKKAFILPEVMGSDHCPIGIEI